MRFRKWLRAQTERTDGIGQLARDVDNWKYTYFPNAQTERAVVNYLKSIGATDETIAAGKQAIHEWHNQMSSDVQPVIEGGDMITEGPHRQQLRLLVDRLPDGSLDAAIVFLSKLTRGTFDLPNKCMFCNHPLAKGYDICSSCAAKVDAGEHLEEWKADDNANR